ncbi:MAG: hypothetical protein ABIQ97_03850, partial [Lysobacteraceae bacterium]
DPLNFVPADTPYVIANIDPVPADISKSWLDRMNKTGKMGDIYAAQLDSFASMLRKQAQAGSTNCEAKPADTANTDAMADGMKDGSDSAGTDMAKPDAEAKSATQNMDCAKDAAMAALNSEKSLKLIAAVKTEVAGKDMQGLMDLAGISPQTHAAFYGIGLAPVLRMELAKPDNLRATMGRVESASGSKLGTGKVGTLDYWIFDGGKADAKMRGVFAIEGKHLVATIAPTAATDATLRALFGLDKPAQSLAKSGALATLDKDMGYLSYGSGYIDAKRLVAILKAPATPLETDYMTAMGQTKPVVDAACGTEYDAIAATWPRASFGYTDLSVNHASMRGVLETKAEIAKDLMRLRAPMPGMAVAKDGLFDIGFSANLAVLPELAAKYADANTKAPFKCKSLVGLNESFDKSKAQLSNPMVTGYAPMFHGLHLVVDKLEFKDGQPMPDIAGLVAIGSDNPGQLLAMAGSVAPQIGQLGLKPDGMAKPLPAIPGMPLTQPMQAAMTDKLLAVSVGVGEEAKIPQMLKLDAAQQPLFAAGAKGEVYRLLAQIQRKTAASMADPEQKQMMEQQAKLMEGYADWFKRMDMMVDLTEKGIEFRETIDMQ